MFPNILDLKGDRIYTAVLQPALCSFVEAELVIMLSFVTILVFGFCVVITIFFVFCIPFGKSKYLLEFLDFLFNV